MANSTLSLTAKFDNPYEAAYNVAKGSEYFNQQDWDTFARRGQLDNYLTVLSESDKLPVGFKETKRFDLLNTDLRFAAMANELYGDRTNLATDEEGKPIKETKFNTKTGKEETRELEMTQYEYTNYLIDQRLSIEYEKVQRQIDQERKDNMNGFVRFLSSAFSTVVLEPTMAITDFVQDFISLFEGVVDGFANIGKEGGFDKGFREAFNTQEWGGSDARIFDEIGFTDWVKEFESQYTNYRDLDGNLTSMGKYLAGIPYSLGKALPTIALNFVTAGTAGSASAVAANMAKAATAIYFVGMGLGEFRELASDPRFASVPTYKLMANATIKTALEYLVMKGVSSAFGATQLDKLMWGQATKSVTSVTAKEAVKRIAHDFIAEGTEEFLQQYSGYIVDQFMAGSDEEFGKLSEWNAQTMFDAFMLGGISTLATNVMSITKSGAQDFVRFLKDKKNGIVKSSPISGANILASWQFKHTLRDLSSEYRKIKNDTKMTTQERQQAFGQMYATMRVIADVYGEIGDVRFNAAQDMLSKMSELDAKTSMTRETMLKKAEIILQTVHGMKLDLMEQSTRDALEQELVSAKMTKTSSVIERGIDETTLSESVSKDALATVKRIFESDPNVLRVVITEDGNTVVSTNDTIFIPIKYAISDNGTMVLKTMAEKALVKNIIASDKLKIQLTELKNLFEMVSNRKDVDLSEVVYNIFFNDSFYKIALHVANRQMLELLNSLEELELKAVGNTVRAATYKKRLQDVMTEHKKALANYLALQPYAQYKQITMLSPEQKSAIAAKHWSKDLANRILANEKLSDSDINFLKAKINSMAANAEKKADVRTGLGFNENWEPITTTKKGIRSAFMTLDKYYRDVFQSPYNGRTYLANNTTAAVLFNRYLESLGMTIDSLGSADIEYHREQFQKYTAGRFNFEYRNGKVNIVELKRFERTGFNLDAAHRLTKAGELSKRTHVTVNEGGKELISPIIDTTISAVDKVMIRINDVIYEPSLLSDTIKNDIINMEGGLIPENTFLYLRQYFLKQTGTITIVALADGTFVFGDVRPMLDSLTNRDIKLSQITDGTTLKKFIKHDYLTGRLIDTSVKFSKDGTYYDVSSNTIFIDENSTNEEFVFALLHEFQHAIQAENKLNNGMDYNFLQKLSKKTSDKLIKDVRLHKPELFDKAERGSDLEKSIVRDFIYYTSGESQAYGMEAMSDVNNFYPTIVNEFSELITPWGTKYYLGNSNVVQNFVMDIHDILTLDNDFVKINDWIKTRLNQTEPMDDTQLGLVLPDGTVGFSNIENSHEQLFMNAKKIFGDKVDQYVEYLSEIAVNSRFGTEFYEQYSIRVNGNLTAKQTDALISTIGRLQRYGARVEAEHVPSKQYVSAEKGLSGYKLLLAIGGKTHIPIEQTKEISERQKMEEIAFSAMCLKYENEGKEFQTFKLHKQIESLSDEKLTELYGKIKGMYAKVLEAKRGQIMSLAKLEPPKQPGKPKKYKNIVKATTKEGVEVIYEYERVNVTKKAAGQTNLKYFVGKQIPPEFAKFLVNADSTKLDPELWDMIGGSQKGTLTKTIVINWLRRVTKPDRYTFALINAAFFKNEHIKTFEQLEYLISMDIEDYYALRGVLREIGVGDLLFEQLSHSKFKELFAEFQTKPEIKKKMDAIKKRFGTYHGNKIEIDYENMRIAFMKYFDGSIESAGYVASIGKMLAITGWKVPAKVSTISMETETGDDITLGDTISDPTSQEAFEEINNRLTDLEREQRVTAVYLATINALDKIGANYDSDKMLEAINNLSDEILNNRFAKLDVAETTGVTLTKKAIENDTLQIIRPRVNITSNMKHIATTIRNNLSKNDLKRFVNSNPDLFESDGKLKRDVYEGKSRNQLMEIEDILRALSKDVRLGVYRSRAIEEIIKQRDKAVKKLELEKQKSTKARLESRQRTIVIGDNEFEVNSDIEMPASLRLILDTTFETFYKTDVKFLTPDDEKHVQMNLKTFIEQNAQRLGQLTDGEISDIITFYDTYLLQGKQTTASAIKFESFKTYVLAFLHRQSQDGKIFLSAEQIGVIERILKFEQSLAGTKQAVWKSVLPMIDPTRIIMQSLARSTNLEFKEATVKEVSDAIRSGDLAKIKEAQRKLYQEGLELHKGTQKSFWDKLWRFQRMMMLSSPGTALRNLSSNFIVTGGNKASGVIGHYVGSPAAKRIGNGVRKILSKVSKGKISATQRPVSMKQYKIVGTKADQRITMPGFAGKLLSVKVPSSTAAFIKANILDNGFIDLIADGLNKYDVRSAGKKTATEITTDLIVRSVTSQIFQQQQFDTKFMNGLGKVIFKMLSDDPFIRKTAISYFGKMLTEDKTDLSNGLTTAVMETFAEAYTLASWDYMHKPNMFNKIEMTIKQRGGSAALYAYKQLFPFASASWNWFLEGLKYTPIGLVKSITDLARLESKLEKMEIARQKGEVSPSGRFAEYLTERDLGKGILGSVLFLAGTLLGAFGVAQLDEEDDKIKLRVGDVYVDISGLFGTQSILLGIALTNPRKGNWEKSLYEVLEVMFFDSTFNDLFNTFRYSDTIGEWAANQFPQMLGMYIPNALKMFNRLIYNHKIQYTSGIMGGFERLAVQSVPGLAYAMPKRVDPYTGEIQTKFNLPFLFEFINSVLPLDFYNYRVSDIEKQAIALGVSKGELTGDYKDIGKLSLEDKEKLNKLYGQYNDAALQDLFNNKGKFRVQMDNGKYKELSYNQMSEEQKKRVVERIMSDNAKYAKIAIHTGNGGKYYANKEEFDILKELGITTNIYKENVKKGQEGFM